MYSQLPSITGGRSSIRNLRTRHAVVTGTHLTRTVLIILFFMVITFTNYVIFLPCLQVNIRRKLSRRGKPNLGKARTFSCLERYLNFIFFIPFIVDNQITIFSPTKCNIFFPNILYYHMFLVNLLDKTRSFN
jgi:hypothetical protein